ncbi:MAG: cyclase family protein [Firmicutes bacterium]|nr:cyclase family protein [Bacillota bacterium]
MKKAYGKLPLPKMSPYLLSRIESGEVYDLGVVRSHDMPLWPGHPPFQVLPYKWHGDTEDVGAPATLYNEMLVTCMHAGTHMDALCHIGEIRGDKIVLGGEVDAAGAREWWGSNWMDGSNFHPIVVRAVILDMLQYKGGEDTGGEVTLPRKYAITIEDVKGYMEENDIEVKPEEPTAFLFRTGMIKYFHKKDESYGGDAAGPDLETQKYLASIGGVVTGSDTVSYEQMLIAEHPVHRWSMQNGVILTEVLDLEEACAAGVTEGVYIALPLKIKGTGGSLIDPIVIA